MQTAFPFGAERDIALIRNLLAKQYGRLVPVERLEPMQQLVRSVLGSRTQDIVSWPAFERLIAAYPRWADLAEAHPEEVEAVIADVTFADRKARQIGQIMHRIKARSATFDLGFLAEWPLDAALAWLGALPGVGPKIATATMNFSTFDRKAFVADTHVMRFLHRYGVIGIGADAWRAHELVLSITENWNSLDLVELHALVKRHGQLVCHHHAPQCHRCPLAKNCAKIMPPLASRRKRPRRLEARKPLL